MYRLLLISFVLLISCTQKKTEMIMGKWKIDDIVTPINWSKVEPERRVQIEKDIQEHVATQKALGYYEFFPEGKATSFDGKTEFKFRWRMNEEETKIFFKPINGTSEDGFDIAEMNKTRFVLTRKDADGEFRITLVK